MALPTRRSISNPSPLLNPPIATNELNWYNVRHIYTEILKTSWQLEKLWNLFVNLCKNRWERNISKFSASMSFYHLLESQSSSRLCHFSDLFNIKYHNSQRFWLIFLILWCVHININTWISATDMRAWKTFQNFLTSVMLSHCKF